MSVIDVEKMINEKEKVEKKENIKEKIEDNKLKDAIKPKKSKFVFKQNNTKSLKIPTIPYNFINRVDEANEKEIKSGVKQAVFKLASMPIKLEKREQLYKNLNGSDYLNKYVDNNIYI